MRFIANPLYVEQWRKKRYEDAAYAEAPTGNIPQQTIPTDKVGHFMSMVFKKGVRSYMFHGTKNRDRFVNLYRHVGARQVGKDPCP
jgi:hypothetical protein